MQVADLHPVLTVRVPGALPAGGGTKRTPKQSKVFGAGGIDRAKRKGWVTS